MTDLSKLTARMAGQSLGWAQPASGAHMLAELVRRWRLIAGITLAVMVLGTVYAYRLAPQVYRTHATVMINPQDTSIIDVNSVLSALSRDTQVLNTQAEVLRSRRLVSAMVRDLDLVRDPEFNPGLERPQTWRGASRRWLQDAGLIRPVADPFTDAEAQETATVNALMRRIEVAVEPETLVLSVAIGTREAGKSARIVNHLTSLYVADQLVSKQQATEAASAWLAARVAGLQADLQRAESRAEAWHAANGNLTETRLIERERQLEAAKARGGDTLALEAEIGQLSDKLAQGRQLNRDADAIRVHYHLFEARLKETTLLDGSLEADARILSAAVVPLYPASPKPALLLALAGIAGVTLGVLAALALAQMRPTYGSRDAMEDDLGLGVIATVPMRGGRGAATALTTLEQRLQGFDQADVAIYAGPDLIGRARWLAHMMRSTLGRDLVLEVERTMAGRPPVMALVVLSENTSIPAARRLALKVEAAGARRAAIVLVTRQRRLPRRWQAVAA